MQPINNTGVEIAKKWATPNMSTVFAHEYIPTNTPINHTNISNQTTSLSPTSSPFNIPITTINSSSPSNGFSKIELALIGVFFFVTTCIIICLFIIRMLRDESDDAQIQEMDILIHTIFEEIGTEIKEDS